MNLDNHNNLITLVKGAGIAFSGLIISRLLSYVYRIIIARNFGPDDYGLFSIGLAVFTIFSVLMMLGFNNTIIHYISLFLSRKEERKVRGVILFSVKLIVPISIALSAALYLFSDFIAGTFFSKAGLGEAFRLFSLALPFYSLVLLGAVIFVGFQKIKYSVYSDHIGSNVFKVGFLLIFIAIGIGSQGIILSWVASMIVASAMSVYFIFRIFPSLRAKGAEYMRREMLVYALPLFLSNIIIIFYMYIDVLALGYFPQITIGEVGIYSASSTLAQVLTIITLSLTALFLPMMTELYSLKKRGSFSQTYRTVSRWAMFLMVPAVIVLLAFSRQLLGIFFGQEYSAGSQSLFYLGIGYMFFSLSKIPSLLLNAINKTRIIFYANAVSLSLCFALNMMLIPEMGILGAAVAVLISNLVMFSLLAVASYRFERVVSVDRSVIKPLASGILAAIIVNQASRMIFTEFPLLVMLLLFAGFSFIYLAILVLLKSFSREDIEILKYVEAKSGLRLGFARNIIKRFIQ